MKGTGVMYYYEYKIEKKKVRGKDVTISYAERVRLNVLDAAKKYQKRVGKPAGACKVHPTMLKEEPLEVCENGSCVEVRTSRSVLPNHYFMGESFLNDQ